MLRDAERKRLIQEELEKQVKIKAERQNSEQMDNQMYDQLQ